jgi:hypothetical protein
MVMHSQLLALALLALGAPRPTGSAGGDQTPPAAFETACPAVKPQHVARVRQFFAAGQTRELREQSGIGAIRPNDIRPLIDSQDAETCLRMSQAVRVDQSGPYPKVWRGYQAGDFYIMTITTEVPPGVIYGTGGGGGTIVLDAEMQVVAAYR